MSRLNANLLLLAVALIWGSAFVAQIHGMAGVGPMTFTGIRFLLGCLVIAPLALREWPEVRGRGTPLRRNDVLAVAGLGVLLALGAAFQQIGLLTTTATNAGFLTALYVPLVPLLSWLWLKAAPHWSVWAASAGCVFGTYLLSGSQGLALSTGDTWIVASSVFWAAHVLFVGRVAERIGAPFLVAAGQFLVCGVLAFGWALASEPISWSGVREALWPLAYAGFLSVGIGFTGQVIAQRHTHGADAAIILSAETVFAAVFGALILGDRLNAAGLVGCALILVCILAVQLLPLFAAVPASARKA